MVETSSGPPDGESYEDCDDGDRRDSLSLWSDIQRAVDELESCAGAKVPGLRAKILVDGDRLRNLIESLRLLSRQFEARGDEV